ncbi:MAG: hypothetical protein ACRDAQ_00810 [Cetobacterium sp.]
MNTLISLYSSESLPIKERIRVFRELIDHVKPEEMLSPLLQDVKADLKLFYEKMVFLNDFQNLKYFERLFPDTDFKKQIHKHLYSDAHNVHTIVDPTIRTALQIIEKYPAPYFRPFNHVFFDVIERSELFQEKVSLPLLFASIDLLINSESNAEIKEEMIKRLHEEMNEAKDTCLTGHFSRLINSIRGFTSFDIVFESYEVDRAKIFYQLNKRVDLDNFIESVEEIINNLNTELSTSVLLKILKAYTKTDWIFTNGKYSSV